MIYSFCYSEARLWRDSVAEFTPPKAGLPQNDRCVTKPSHFVSRQRRPDGRPQTGARLSPSGRDVKGRLGIKV